MHNFFEGGSLAIRIWGDLAHQNTCSIYGSEASEKEKKDDVAVIVHRLSGGRNRLPTKIDQLF